MLKMIRIMVEYPAMMLQGCVQSLVRFCWVFFEIFDFEVFRQLQTMTFGSDYGCHEKSSK
jgi:hypothetical protein